MSSALFFSFMTSLLIGMALIPPLRLMAERFSIMDAPGERKVHQYPVPRVGGIAFALGACASILWWVPKDGTTFSVLLADRLFWDLAVDDRANLGYRIKLLGQLAAAFTVIIVGGIRFESIPFLFDAELPMWIGIPVTALFLVAVSNAVNLTDGLDGLAGGFLSDSLRDCVLGVPL
jgi:UDP-GlcNAc:undecaprenyl-phosphate GlcNAc-1-phosphate transferase